MLADLAAVRRHHRPGSGRQVLRQEFAEVALADETDAGRVLLRGGRQAGVGGHAAHVGLDQFAQREQGRCQLRLAELVQEIALVLAAVGGAQQLPGAILFANPGVMAGGDEVGAQFTGGVEEMLELDLAVAQHVGVRRAPGGVFGEEMLEHAGPVFIGEIAEMDRQAQPAADRDRVAAVVLGAAVAAAVVGPVAHEQPGHAAVRVGQGVLAQQQGRDRGIDAAGHADDDAGSRHGVAALGQMLQHRQRRAVTGEVIGDHLPDQRAAVAFALRQQLVRGQP